MLIKEGAGSFSVHIESCIFSKLGKWDYGQYTLSHNSNKAPDLN